MPFPYPFPIEFGIWPTVAVVIGAEIQDIEKGSVGVNLRIEERSTAKLALIDVLGSSTYIESQPISIYDQTDTLIFGGFIDGPGKARQGAIGLTLAHDIACKDNHYLADKRLVVKSYSTPGQTVGSIVRDIFTDYLVAEGITEGEIQEGPEVSQAIFNYVRVSECYDALKELSGFTWFIDEQKRLYFINRTTYLAAWDLDGVAHRAVKGSIHLLNSNPLYRNKQYVRGGKGITSDQTEVFTGDGNTLSFTVGFPLAQEPTVTVADRTPEAQTVGIKGLEAGLDCYWNKGDATVTFGIAPENAKTVTIVFKGQYPIIAQVSNIVAQSARQAVEGGTGIVEDIVTEASHESMLSAWESANAKILQYCRSAERFTYQTYEQGLTPGQLQRITYAPFGFANHEMLVESVSITALGEAVLYDVSCITGPAVGSWAKFFANLLSRQDKQIKVGDGLLLVLLQTQEILELAEAGSIDEDEFAVSGNVNRWLNAAPISAGSLYNIQHERLEMVEATPPPVGHITEDYYWDDADMLWDFFTWA